MGGVATARSCTEGSLWAEKMGLTGDAPLRPSWKALSLSLPVGLLYALSVPATPGAQCQISFQVVEPAQSESPLL